MAFEKAHSKGNVQNSPLLNVEAGGRFCQLDIYSAYTEVEMQSLTDIMFYIRWHNSSYFKPSLEMSASFWLNLLPETSDCGPQ